MPGSQIEQNKNKKLFLYVIIYIMKKKGKRKEREGRVGKEKGKGRKEKRKGEERKGRVNHFLFPKTFTSAFLTTPAAFSHSFFERAEVTAIRILGRGL